MFHHDKLEYNEAVSAAAAKAREKLEEVLSKASPTALNVVGLAQDRAITDVVAKTPSIKVQPLTADRFALSAGDGAFLELHDHAFGQVVERSRVGMQFVKAMRAESKSDWPLWLVADTINKVLANRTGERNLIRSEDNTIKGFLSDKFRRLDTRPLLDSFMGGCSAIGLLPYQGVMGDTKFRLRAVLPRVFEPVPNEPMVFGVEFANSDYGDGTVGLSLWLMRMWCTNLAIGERTLTQRHLGGRLPDDIQLSQRTYELDTKTMASAIADVLQDTVGPDRVNRMCAVIAASSEQEVKSRDGIEKRLKDHLGVAERKAVTAMYEGPDTVNLPSGPTVYRLSNAVSFFAQSPGVSSDRRIELQEIAGTLLGIKAKPAKEV